MRLRLLDRYVAGEFLRLFTLFALSAPVLFILGDLTDQLDNYLDQGLTTQQVALSYLYQLPLFVLYSFPIAALIATVFTLSNMTRHSEVAAAKAGGISFFRLTAPLPLLGLLLTVGALGLSELVPITNRMRSEAIGETESGRTSRSDFVYRSASGRVFSIRQLNVRSGHIRGVVVEREGDEPNIPGIHVVARSASYTEDTGWTLENGYVRLFAGPTVERSFRFERMRPLHFTETPDELLAEPREPEDMGYAELGRFIENLERSGGRPLELKVERAQKIALPLATLVIILFAAPLATSSHRSGPAYGVGISLAITIVYLMLLKVAGAAGATGALPPMLAAWLPNLAFLVAAGVMMTRVRT